MTTSPAFEFSNVTVGDRTSKARKRLSGEQKLLQHGSVAVFRVRNVLIGMDRKQVRLVAVGKHGLSARAVGAWLDLSR